MRKLIILLFIVFPLNSIAQSSNNEKYTCHEDSIFVIVDKMPEFPGGEIALRKYIADNIKYPKVPVEEVNIGKTYVEFCVNKIGNVERVRVIRSIHPKFDKEAIRVISSLPKWIPGKNKGRPVCVYYTIPINVPWK